MISCILDFKNSYFNLKTNTLFDTTINSKSEAKLHTFIFPKWPPFPSGLHGWWREGGDREWGIEVERKIEKHGRQRNWEGENKGRGQEWGKDGQGGRKERTEIDKRKSLRGEQRRGERDVVFDHLHVSHLIKYDLVSFCSSKVNERDHHAVMANTNSWQNVSNRTQSQVKLKQKVD